MPQNSLSFLYQNGVMTALGTGHSEANDISNSGDIVGSAHLGQQWHAALYGSDQWNDLTIGTGWSQYYYSWAYGVNNYGDVVGYHDYSNAGIPKFPPPWNKATGFVYSDGTMTTFAPPTGYDSSEALAINDSGQVAGIYYNTSSWAAYAFLSSGGVITNISGDAHVSTGWDRIHMNGLGDVVGNLNGSGFLYSNGETTSFGTAFACNGINDVGQIVGWDSSTWVGKLYENGQFIDLSAAIQDNPGWTLVAPMDINNLGQIVGVGTNPSGEDHAFLLTPTPEPSTLVLLSAGAAGLLARAWRRRKRTA